ncbi:hypothetical protein [Spartinivicinus poritis]|uniref:Uncharacterized protein n=1 Tax=Spartinivicinus poritis TaxID=2994640 RepID=A0ABT5U6Z3_9GAMM|nr:hypothetical protein [Spartinivicinus sp. A2-2]MDE1462139.1 hypothetical protein [Spartinivicinus sp. A2-2]
MDIPAFLFNLPEQNSSHYIYLVEFLNIHKDKCIPFLPWLTAEILSYAGAEKMIEVIRQYGSCRVDRNTLCDLLEGDHSLQKIFELNCSSNNMLEVQSMSGLISDLRRFSVNFLLKRNTCPQDIVLLTGVSFRTIQRAKSQLKDRVI